jgi:hypothetical protein
MFEGRVSAMVRVRAAAVGHPAGTSLLTVHDSAAVTGVQEGPIPTGTVTSEWFTGNDCNHDNGEGAGSTAVNNNAAADGDSFRAT